MSRGRPRILYICSAWPHGEAHGGQLRALHIGRALKEFGDVTVLVVSPDAVPDLVAEKTAAEFELALPIHPRTTPNRGAVEKLRWALDPIFLNVHGSSATLADRHRVVSLVEEFDLV